jgi:hypothetical protein
VTGLAMLLASMPKDFRLGALIASKNLQKEYKEDLFAMGHCKCWREKGIHLLDRGCVECREEVNPCKSAICISHS